MAANDDDVTWTDNSLAAKGAVAKLAMRFCEAGANVVRNDIVRVMELSKPSGRVYRLPGYKRATYTASAPGQPPAMRFSNYAQTWAFSPATKTGSEAVAWAFNPTRVGNGRDALGAILERGRQDGTILPRPHILIGRDLAVPELKLLAVQVFGGP